MSKKIKFSFIKFLYSCFAFLADKTGGWKIFVQPKLFLGTALILTATSCGQKTTDSKQHSQNIDIMADCYQGTDVDTMADCYLSLPFDILNDNDTVYTVVQTKPEFPGGDKALLKFIEENIKFPAPQDVMGKVYLNFVVEKSGKISNITIAKGVRPTLDNEAVRLVKSMPNWIPAKYDGKIVSSYFTLPVTFILK